MLSQPYKNLIGRCAVLFSAGTALQFLVGPVNPSFLAYPWGIVLAVNYLYVLILLYCQADKWKWVKKWYDRPACIVSLVSLLILTLFFGLNRLCRRSYILVLIVILAKKLIQKGHSTRSPSSFQYPLRQA